MFNNIVTNHDKTTGSFEPYRMRRQPIQHKIGADEAGTAGDQDHIRLRVDDLQT
jgi:hypothetical protein